MQIKENVKTEIFMPSFMKMIESSGLGSDVVDFNPKNKTLKVTLEYDSMGLKLGKRLQEIITLGEILNNLSEEDSRTIRKEELLEEHGEDSLAFKQPTNHSKDSGTLYIFDSKVIILQDKPVIPTENLGETNTKFFTDRFLECSTEFFLQLNVADFYVKGIQYIENSRLKRLNVQDIYNKIEAEDYFRLDTVSSVSIENPTKEKIEYLANIVAYNNDAQNIKKESLIYATYIALEKIQEGLSLNYSIVEASITKMPLEKLKLINKFYGLDTAVVGIYKTLLISYGFPEEPDFQINFEDTSGKSEEEEYEEILKTFSNILFEYIPVIYPETLVKEMLGSRYKRADNFKQNTVPRLKEIYGNQKERLLSLTLEALNQKYPRIEEGTLISSIEETFESPSFLASLYKEDIKEFFSESSLSENARIVTKLTTVVNNALLKKYIFGGSTTKQELYDSLKDRLSRENYVYQELALTLEQLQIIIDNKILPKVYTDVLEQIISEQFDLSLTNAIKNEDYESIINNYRLLFKGGL